jgi:tryptophan 2,3-dioxygenase
VEFLEFRDRLMPASGFQSTQFREIEILAGLKEPHYLSFFKKEPEFLKRLEKRLAADDLGSTFLTLLKELGFKVPQTWSGKTEGEEYEAVLRGIQPIYQNAQRPEANLHIYLLSESLVDLDQALALWREHHVRVVERIIGFRRGTGGSSGVGYLRTTTVKKCFPYLWDVRSLLEKPQP